MVSNNKNILLTGGKNKGISKLQIVLKTLVIFFHILTTQKVDGKNVTNLELVVEPEYLQGFEDETLNITISLQCSDRNNETEGICMEGLDPEVVQFVNFNGKENKYLNVWLMKSEAENATIRNIDQFPVRFGENTTIFLNCSMLGITDLEFSLASNDSSVQDPSIVHLVVGRDAKKRTMIINILFTLILLVALFFMGIEIDIQIVLKTGL